MMATGGVEGQPRSFGYGPGRRTAPRAEAPCDYRPGASPPLACAAPRRPSQLLAADAPNSFGARCRSLCQVAYRSEFRVRCHRTPRANKATAAPCNAGTAPTVPMSLRTGFPLRGPNDQTESNSHEHPAKSLAMGLDALASRQTISGISLWSLQKLVMALSGSADPLGRSQHVGVTFTYVQVHEEGVHGGPFSVGGPAHLCVAARCPDLSRLRLWAWTCSHVIRR